MIALAIALTLTQTEPSLVTPPEPASVPLVCPLDAPYDPSNPFARIIRGELPASRVFEDDRVLVIMPLGWNNPGHTLVIPKRAVRNLGDMTPEEMGYALEIARRVGVAQQRALGSNAYTIQQNNGRSQHVCHVHFHVNPNTPLKPQNPVPRTELDEMAKRLRAAMPDA